MRKYSVVNEEGVVEEFIQLVGEADHAALNDAIELARRAGEDVVAHSDHGANVVVWSIDDDQSEPWEGEDRFADGDALASAGFGTDEDYGCFDAGDEW